VGGKAVKCRLLVVTTRDIGRIHRDAGPHVGIQFTPGKLLDRIRRQGAEFLVGNRLTAVANQKKIGQGASCRVQGCKTAGISLRAVRSPKPEDYDDGRRCATVLAESLQEWMTRSIGHSGRSLSGSSAADAREMPVIAP